MQIRKSDVVVVVGVVVLILVLALVINRISSLEIQVIQLQHENFNLRMDLSEEQTNHELDNIQNAYLLRDFIMLTAMASHVDFTEEELVDIDASYHSFVEKHGGQYTDTNFFGCAYYYALQHQSQIPMELLPETY